MPEQRFRLVADISSDDPAAIEPPLRQLAPDASFWAKGSVRLAGGLLLRNECSSAAPAIVRCSVTPEAITPAPWLL
jgi:hypothetical protein